ncbi:hypothetical protein [Sphingomonas sp.]|uniref:hypothetical protein n=1 Tax=Sphingomonas sp. TaxID=28214 RepID=UPI00257FE069|nr:hypothetical protein [Sphingomonas sp.]
MLDVELKPGGIYPGMIDEAGVSLFHRSTIYPGVCGTAREAPTGSLLGDPSSSSAGTPYSKGAGGPVPSAPIDPRVGITRNYPASMSLSEAISLHRAFIGKRAGLDKRFELDTRNLGNGFVALTAYYVPGPDEARDLNELFGMIA